MRRALLTGLVVVGCSPTYEEFSDIAIADVDHPTACGVLKPDGRVRCWGNHGEEFERLAPTAEFEKIAMEFGDVCGVTRSRQVMCWSLHVPLTTLPDITQVPAGEFVDVAIVGFGTRDGW
ncbi:MAG: hypothetical protein HY904_16385 [Deltaproteobacteria bacterium]|nr:hypothetical protein [Deltaproteobacteria bacterium]